MCFGRCFFYGRSTLRCYLMCSVFECAAVVLATIVINQPVQGRFWVAKLNVAASLSFQLTFF